MIELVTRPNKPKLSGDGRVEGVAEQRYRSVEFLLHAVDLVDTIKELE